MLQGLVVRLLAEHDVAVLGVDILADLHPAGAELGDVGVVADVDGAVGAAQQFLPLHSLQALLRPDALEAGLLVQSGRAEVYQVVQDPASPVLRRVQVRVSRQNITAYLTPAEC